MVILGMPKDMEGPLGGGTWKYAQNTRLLLADLGEPFRALEFEPGRPADLAARCTPADRHLIVEFTFWLEVFREVRRRHPNLLIHAKAPNPEGLQFLHQTADQRRLSVRGLRRAYGALRLAWRDAGVKRCVDTVLSISPWDAAHYWRRLPGGAAVRELPYFSPWPRLTPQVRPRSWSEREDAVICMPGGCDNPIGRANLPRFSALADRLAGEPHQRGWRFLLGPAFGSRSSDPQASPRVTCLSALAEPWEWLCRVRAVAVLTHLGFGTKTTIIDGLAAGCHVLVHPVLQARLPPEVARLCIVCDPEQQDRWDSIAAALAQPPAGNRLNAMIQDEARRTLATVLAAGASARKVPPLGAGER